MAGMIPIKRQAYQENKLEEYLVFHRIQILLLLAKNLNVSLDILQCACLMNLLLEFLLK